MAGIAIAIIIFGALIYDGLTNIGKGLSNLGEFISKRKEDEK